MEALVHVVALDLRGSFALSCLLCPLCTFPASSHGSFSYSLSSPVPRCSLLFCMHPLPPPPCTLSPLMHPPPPHASHLPMQPRQPPPATKNPATSPSRSPATWRLPWSTRSGPTPCPSQSTLKTASRRATARSSPLPPQRSAGESIPGIVETSGRFWHENIAPACAPCAPCAMQATNPLPPTPVRPMQRRDHGRQVQWSLRLISCARKGDVRRSVRGEALPSRSRTRTHTHTHTHTQPSALPMNESVLV